MMRIAYYKTILVFAISLRITTHDFQVLFAQNIADSIQDRIEYNFKVTHYGVDDGLSQGSVYSMLRDSRGFMWMTSYEGLNRFDGRDFKVYQDMPGDSTSLSGNSTIGLVEDGLGRIWVGSNKELNCFDPKTNKFTQPIESGLVDNFHYPFYADSSTIWFINKEEGIVIYDFLRGKRRWSSSRFKYHVNNYDINNVVRSKDGLIWIRVNNRIVKITPGTDDFQIVFEAPLLYRNGELNSISCIKLDLDENLLIGTFSKVYKYNIREDRIQMLFALVEENERIFDVEPYSENMLWIGSNPGGLSLIDRDGREVKQLSQTSRLKERLPSNNVGFLYQDEESILWASTDPLGVSKIQTDRQPFESFSSFDLMGLEVNPNGIRCFEEDEKGNIVIGTQEAGVVYFDPSSGRLIHQIPNEIYPNEHASFLFYDSRGWLWVGSYQGLFVQRQTAGEVEKILLSEETGSAFSDVIWSIVEVDNKNILASTDLGVYQISVPEFRVVHLPVLKQAVTGRMYLDDFGNLLIPEHNNGFVICPKIGRQLASLPDTIQSFHHFQNRFNVKSILYDRSRELYWLFTTSGLYSIETDSSWDKPRIITHFGYEDGLQSTYLYGGFVHDSFIWTGSNSGLHRINLETGRVDVFDKRYGVQGLEYNTNAFFVSESEKYYFGGVSGFESFYPEDIDREVNIPPTPILLSLFVNNEEYSERLPDDSSPFTFKYDENWIRFKFVSTNIKGEGRHKFYYRLKKNNTSWLDSYNDEIEYGLLSPGIYTLEVKVRDDGSGLFSNSTSIPFEVRPPWWGTLWFKTLLLVVLVTSLWVGISFRLKRIREKEQRQKRLAELQLSALQSQMNPHFVFNCMTTIDGYVAQNERRAASLFITRFSKLMRQSLELSRHNRISVSREVNFIRDYVDLERLRFEKEIEFVVSLDHEAVASECVMPPMTLQPIVENAIRHGLTSRPDARLILLDDSMNNGFYCVHIYNDGEGIKMKNKRGEFPYRKGSFGLNLVKERLALFSKTGSRAYSIDWENVTDDDNMVVGVRFTIFIPVLSKPQDD